MSVRLLVADDHPVVIDGVKFMLKDEPDVEIIGKATDDRKVKYILARAAVDILLLDINFGNTSGLDLCKWITGKYPEVKIIAFTMFDDPVLIDGMIQNGAYGYLLKDTGKQELLTAISTVQDGNLYYKGKIAEIIKGGNFKQKFAADQPPKISRREREVMRLILQEYTNNEIAEKLNISPATVISHRKNLLRKLNVRNTAGLVRKAIRLGLIS